MSFRDFLLNEVHWSDDFPKGFIEFRKKYYKFAKNTDLFVQFTNYQTDDINKASPPDNKVDHHDFLANSYAYPLSYVISHPSDIWYGKTAKYLRVLQDKSKNKVVLNYLTKYEANRYIMKMELDYGLIDFAIKEFKLKGKNQIGQAFLKVVQLNLEAQPQYHELDRKKKNPIYPIRTPKEQTNLLLNAGIDALEDRSTRDSNAIINDREPQQIAFLTRHSYDVKEIFFLRNENKFLIKSEPNEKHARKLASMILEKMNDKIISTNKDEKHMFFSQKGRRIEIYFEDARNIRNRKLGQKFHKEYKLSDNYKIKIVMHSEKGQTIRHFSTNEKFKDITYDFYNSWSKESDKNWTPYNLEKYKDEIKAQHDKEMEERLNREKLERIETEKKSLPIIKEVAKKLNIPFSPKPNFLYSHLIENIRKYFRNKENPQEVWNELAKRYEEMKPHFPDDNYLINIIGYIPNNPSQDLQQLKLIINKLFEMQNRFEGLFSFYQFNRESQ